MKSILSAAAGFLLLAGCASSSSSYPPSQTRTEPIKLPSATPFDGDLMARQAYLEGYRDGYLSLLNDTPGNVDMLTGPYKGAREMGWRAGAGAARAATAR